jgi:protein-disulfide isomerase
VNLQSQTDVVVEPHRPPLRGKPALIEVIQYGDFECSDCARAAFTVRSFRLRFDRQIRFLYRHFPLDSLHPHAIQAAEAAECARAQGRFWKMHDLLVANQNRLALQRIYAYAEQARLDMDRFDREMDNEVHLPTVHAHRAAGIAHGVMRTPAFVVDGTLVDSSSGLRPLYEATEIAISLARGSSAIA